jgi:hypothetical protein
MALDRHLEARAAAAAFDRLDAAEAHEGNVRSEYVGDLHCCSSPKRPEGRINLSTRPERPHQPQHALTRFAHFPQSAP